jgi:amino acid permease
VSVLVCSINNVGIIFSIGGAVTANSIVVILPTAFYYKLMILSPEGMDGVDEKPARKSGVYRYTQYVYPFVTGAGVTLMIVMLYKIAVKIMEGK